MKIFDSHFHIFPDKIAARTLEKLTASGGLTPSFDATRSGALRYLKEAGITAALNAPIATKADQVDSINASAAQHEWPLISLGSIHPDSDDKATILRRIKEAGLPGIKLHPEFQFFDIFEDRVLPIYQHCEALELPILFHAGEDVSFPNSCRCRPGDLAKLQRQFPRLKIIAAHFGGWQRWHELEPLIGTSVYLDLSLVFHYRDPKQTAQDMRRHGLDRLLFASDSPWSNVTRDLEILRSLNFTPNELQKICWDNAIKLFNLKIPASSGKIPDNTRQ